MKPANDIDKTFRSFFHAAPHGMVRAPGRVCLVGEHTDYNQGFVLPFALDLAVTVTFRVREDSKVRVRSLRFPEQEDRFDLAEDLEHTNHRWAEYIRGVFYIIRSYGLDLRRGLDLLISSTLAESAGLASSGAMSVAVAGCIRKALNLPLDKRSLALVAEKAENDFFGRHCGIMDPLTAVMARKDHLALIDCEDYAIEHIPFPGDLSVIVFNATTSRDLSGNEFNELRQSCSIAAEALNVGSLRHASVEKLNGMRAALSEADYRRASHIVTEMQRTKQLAEAFKNDKFEQACRLISESHESLQENFRNTTPEIDAVVSLCRGELGDAVGARMTGGGFGGSVIALCKTDQTQHLIANVSRKFLDRFGTTLRVHVCRPEAGMRIRWNQNAGSPATAADPAAPMQ